MAIKRRQNKLQDLAASGIVTNRISGSIPFTHDGPNSPLFTISEIPNPLPQGKSSFLIAGTELLRNKVEVKVEIIDSEGGVIYTEPVANYLEGNARRVSMEVYDDTPPGPATLYILAQVDPEEWEDETGTDVTNYPNPQPLSLKGKRRKKKRKTRKFNKQKIGMPSFEDIMRFGAGAGFTINPNFKPPPENDSRFKRRNGKRRRGTTSDISDQYNFLQSIKLQVVPTATNTEKILFYQEPRVKVFEIFKPFVSNIAASGSIVVSGSLSGQVINDTQGAVSALDNFGATLNTFRRKRKFKKFAGKGGLSKRKRITRRASPEVDNYSFSSPSFNFESKHVGAKIELNTPSINSTQYPSSRYTIPTTGSFEVLKVKNSSTVIPDKPFRIYDRQLAQSVDVPIESSPFSIEFDPEVTRSISITNFRSYADVRVSNIRTFSGDVFRTKIYRKSEESISDYELFADLPLESSELLLNTTEGTGLERTGYFVSQSDAVNYWEVSQSLSGLTGNAATASAKYNIDTQMDSIHISGSNKQADEYVRFNLNKTYSFTLEKDVNYDFSAEIYGTTAPKIVNLETGGTEEKVKAELEVFISGSNIPAQQGNENFGAKVGVLRVDDGSEKKDFGITTGDFESTSKSENCILTFKVNAGQFYIADISVRPATETGFSPDLFTFTAPMPSNEVRPETYEFLAEFYDVNNNQADAFTFTATGSEFKGSNMVITGEDNVLESNLFIGGESTASGMHLGGVSSKLPETGGPGAAGSGFMRSVGYTGFTSASNQSLGGKFGFMIYSGSVLPDSGDDYLGVGLELVGQSGSLKFRTNPSVFDVRADSFFVGRESIQFISGAEGNIEISSSEFHLTPEGNVTASEMLLGDKAGGNFLQFAGSTLTVQGDIAVDSLRTPATIGGSTSTTSNASSSIDAQGFASFKSASIAGFVVNPVAIHSADKSLVMSASGQITGSTVLFTGGKIASFTLSDDAFTAGNSFFISSSVESARSFFISSSKFNVKAGGDITGSDVLFDGGKVGGWTIGNETLTGGNLILDKAGDIKSADYQSDVKGWLISSQDNGFAEFENAKIRGTLSTTTFEKESVNAVGGQLFIANSTAITGSVITTAATTMSVVNASGFANGEILQIKKVTNTGFNTEYVKINSASLDGDLSKDELHGRIYVQRALTSTSSSLSASVGDGVGGAQQYEPGQVVVSTGKVGTGYIRLNANPNNEATPYMDIVERTGSNIYDVELKTRVGDLSGVAGSRNVPSGFTGFGIMSEVAFLSGSNIKLETPSFILGDINSSFVSGSEAKLEISASNFHLSSSGDLKLGQAPTARVAMIPSQRRDPNVGNYYNTVSSSFVNSSTIDDSGAGGAGSKHPMAWFRFNFPDTSYTNNSNVLVDDEAITDKSQTPVSLLHKQQGTLSVVNRKDNNTNNFISGSWRPKDDGVITSVTDAFTTTKFNDSSIRISSAANGHLSFSVWLNPTTVAVSTEQIILKWGNDEYGLSLYQVEDDVYFEVYDSDASSSSDRNFVKSTSTLSVDSWHHIVGVYNAAGSSSATLNLYVNKVLSTQSLAGTSGVQYINEFQDAILSIGALYGSIRMSTDSWTSRTDTSSPYLYPSHAIFGEVIIMNAELAQADVDMIYNTANALTDGNFSNAISYDVSDSSIDIRTKSFVFGMPHTDGFAFISGSDNGILEISSSNFHVSGGDVSMTGDINATSGNFKGTLTATGGNIGGFLLVSSSNSYISSNVDKTSYTDTSAGVYLGTDGIGLGTGQFKVSATGAITSTSGTIGGWTLGNTTLTAGDILLDEGNELIQIGNSTTNIKLDIESNKGVFKMTQASKERLEMSDALNYGRKGMRFNNATLEMSASLIGEKNDEVGIRYGGEYHNTTKHKLNQGNNFFVQKPDVTDSFGFVMRGPFYAAIEAHPSDTLGGGIGYGPLFGYGPNDMLRELSGIESGKYSSYAAMDVKLQVGSMQYPGLGGGGVATTAGRFEIQSFDVENYSNGCYIVALSAFSYDGVWRQSDTYFTSSGMVEPEKAVSGLFGGGRFIVGNKDLKAPSDSANYQLDIRGDTDLATFTTHVKVDQSIGINVTPSATNGRLDASNDVVAYSSSDKRFKENLIRIPGSLDKVMKLSGYEFDWIPDEENHGYEGHDVGIIAQEVEKVLPEVVTTRDSGYKAVKYEKMIPLLIESIKEQQEQIEELKQKVKSLEGN